MEFMDEAEAGVEDGLEVEITATVLEKTLEENNVEYVQDENTVTPESNYHLEVDDMDTAVLNDEQHDRDGEFLAFGGDSGGDSGGGSGGAEGSCLNDVSSGIDDPDHLHDVNNYNESNGQLEKSYTSTNGKINDGRDYSSVPVRHQPYNHLNTPDTLEQYVTRTPQEAAKVASRVWSEEGAVRANSRLQVEEKQGDDVEFYICEWLRHSQEKCDRKGISPAAYEDPMDQ
ncbi:Uncharacterized protein APZ42_026957 [Daphnia magna]|uniref:Uncharacterized protein n=1 Tax=Daphnia magna TaxID=35525 RepID=A0A164RTF0_9CRUS|nr:Uncharacterized protein APZ42_026957 [Daphnia magna]